MSPKQLEQNRFNMLILAKEINWSSLYNKDIFIKIQEKRKTKNLD